MLGEVAGELAVAHVHIVDAGEDVESARAVPVVRARTASRRLEVGIDGVEVRERVAALAPHPRRVHEPSVR